MTGRSDSGEEGESVVERLFLRREGEDAITPNRMVVAVVAGAFALALLIGGGWIASVESRFAKLADHKSDDSARFAKIETERVNDASRLFRIESKLDTIEDLLRRHDPRAVR
jgi:hypothetical protein